jgi:uncharacterized membrane protein YgdD (TMEM256/DUF423 family)
MMTATRIHTLLASLMGAAGIALWARAAHGGLTNLVTAAQFLLIHAVAVLAITACRRQGLVHDAAARWSITVLIVGTLLFAGDLTFRALAGAGLFPMAAPIGGSALILGWLILALAALLPAHQRA